MEPTSKSEETATTTTTTSPSHIYSAIARYALFIVLILSFLYISWRIAEWVIDSVSSFTPTLVIVTESSGQPLSSLSSPIPSTVTEQSIIDMMRAIR
jgi:hypothetical protein